jgi:hypothetical protein
MLLYDHFLTLDQEVEEIWKAKWTLPKIFFLILRYMVPALMIIETYRKPDSLHVNLLGLISMPSHRNQRNFEPRNHN